MKIHKIFEADNSDQDLRMAVLKESNNRVIVEGTVRIENKDRYFLKLFDKMADGEVYFNKIIRV